MSTCRGRLLSAPGSRVKSWSLSFHIALKDGRLKVRCKLDTVGWINVNHLHLARKVFSVCEGTHHHQAIPKDKTICPIHVVLVKFDSLVIRLLRVSKELTLDVLAFCDLQNGFCTDALMHMQRNRIHSKRFRFLFACPF